MLCNTRIYERNYGYMKKRIKRLKILSILLASVCLFSHVSMVADASGTAGTSTSIAITYNNSESGLCYGNTYLPWNWQLDASLNYENTDSESVFWYAGKKVLLFTSSSEFYGYSVQVTRTTNTTNTNENAYQKYWCIGTAGQLMNGENRGGNITSSSFTAWVPTDYSVQAVHMAPLYQFNHAFDLDWEGALEDGDDLLAYDYWGSYSINAKYTVKYTGYKTKTEYDSALSGIQSELQNQTTELEDINTGIGDLNSNLNSGINNLQNGFDSTGGNTMNSNLSSTVDSYVSTENMLFTSAKSGLDSFEFTSIGSAPGLVTAMSLVGSLLTSAYRSMSLTSSGSGGIAQLVLFILFSVMLVSMALGLYHFYQNKKGG